MIEFLAWKGIFPPKADPPLAESPLRLPFRHPGLNEVLDPCTTDSTLEEEFPASRIRERVQILAVQQQEGPDVPCSGDPASLMVLQPL
jgi:hypothetical protein